MIKIIKNKLLSLFNNFTNKKKNQWHKISASLWRQFAPPWRPSKEEIKVYQKIINTVNPKNSLLLGATPEIRDIFRRSKKRITIADFSYNMLVQMQKMMKLHGSNEDWLIKDWLEIDLPNSSFDLVVGDLVERMVSYKKQEKFFKKINSLLKKQGSFVIRVHYLNNKIKKAEPMETLKELLGLYHQKKISSKEFQNSLVFRLFDRLTNSKTHCAVGIEIGSLLKKLLTNSLSGNKKIVKDTLDKYGRDNFIYTQLKKEELEINLKKYFKVVKRYFVNDYLDAKFHPIYLMSKKLNSLERTHVK